MKKKLGLLAIPVTLVVAIVLIALIVNGINSVKKQTEDNCFRYLDDATHQLIDDLHKTTEMDHNVLSAMASMVATQSDASNSVICKIMSSYSTKSSYVDYVEMLRPDNTMLDSDGNVRDVSGSFEFDKEAQKGAYISNINVSTKKSTEMVIRNAVPVRKNGKTVSMLYGVIRLNNLKEKYITNIYDGNAYVFLIDGNTGEFFLDTWHKSFGNISDYYGRKTVSGDSFQEVGANLKNSKGGDLSFISHTTGDTLYMHYEPVKINNWSVLVTVQEQYAMKESNEINDILFRSEIQCGVILLLYLVIVIISFWNSNRGIRRISMNDPLTGLKNRNAFEAYVSINEDNIFDMISCVFIDANGLHELNNNKGHGAGDIMLQYVAKLLQREFHTKNIFRTGGDEFVAFLVKLDEETCITKLKGINEELREKGYSVSYGVVTERNITGISKLIEIADARMLENKRDYYSKHDRRQR